MEQHTKPMDTFPVIGAIAGIAIGWWVGSGPVVQALILLMSADILFGILAVVKRGDTLAVKTSFWGIVRKICIYLLVKLVGFVSLTVGDQLGFPIPAESAVALWFCSTELISVLRNADILGISLGPLRKIMGDKDQEII